MAKVDGTKAKKERLREYRPGELEEINAFRKEMGMRPIIPEDIKCIRCGKVFHSCDPLRVRFCPSCKYTLELNGDWEDDKNYHVGMVQEIESYERTIKRPGAE